MTDDPVIGIDLGTTNSVVAWLDRNGRPTVLPDPAGMRITPSVVQIRPDGTAVVGDVAKQEIALECEHTAQFFKRDMGTDTVFEYRGRPFTPTDLSALVLRKLKHDAEQAMAAPVRRAVVTVPAYFLDGARVATRAAGEAAGLDVLEVMSEPTAAAMAYCFGHAGKDEVVLVYDLGGGTFDVSLVRVAPGQVEVIATDGNHRLGGKDWDDRLLVHACEEFRRRHDIQPLEDAYLYQELLVRAEETKKALSQRSRATLAINCGGRLERIEITRDAFAALTADLLAQTEALVVKVLADAGCDLARLGSVLMVGGSTRMPMCVEMVTRLAGRPPNVGLNPDECVALGAAIHGAALTAGPRRGTHRLARVKDVMSHSLGMIAVSTDGTRFVNTTLIAKNRPIPCRELRPYKAPTRAGANNSVTAYVTQGESDDPAHVSFVGKYVITGITHAPSGQVVDIAYAYNASGVVAVTAVERDGQRALEVQKQAVPNDMSWVSGFPAASTAVARTFYVAVDLSGSMAGEPLREAKRAAISFIEKSDLSRTSIGLIGFHDDVRIDHAATQQAEALYATIQGWSAGGGNDGEPVGVAFEHLRLVEGQRLLVLLTDGVWSTQSEAIAAAQRCREAGIEIIAIGMGGADRSFLERLATSDEAALFVSTGDLESVFGTIAQVMDLGDGGFRAPSSLKRKG